MKLEELKNKRILIVGRGIEGNAVYKYLRKHLPNAVIEIVDQKDGENYLDKQTNYDIAIKSPGVKKELIKIPYTTSTNIFLANTKGKVIGVTGTKGKSTTSTLIYEMLKTQGKNVYFAGNIGRSPLEFLDKLNDQPASPLGESWVVLELSSFQLQDLKIGPASPQGGPHIAVMLMIDEEHLDYHKTYEKYIDAKRNIFRFQTPSDYAVINRDNLTSHKSDIYTKAKVFWISREIEVKEGCFVKEGKIQLSVFGSRLSDKSHSVFSQSVLINRQQTNQNPKTENRKLITEEIIDIKDILLPGKHNLENVCAAVMAATIAGVTKENIVEVLKSFKGLEHRLEFVKDVNGVRFYNDSLATIPRATMEALEALPETETLIAGGHDRGIDYAPLGKYLTNGQIKTLILFPTTGKRIWEEICKARHRIVPGNVVSESNRPEKFDVKTMEQAVGVAFAETLPGKICLLSPASASFGIFKDYKDRGDQFKREVNKLKSEYQNPSFDFRSGRPEPVEWAKSEMVRQAHHPERSRRTNPNDQNTKSKTF